MLTTTITVARKTAPKPGKKNWTIMSPEEVFYSVPPAVASNITQGGRYSLQYEEATFNDIIFNMVKSAKVYEPAQSSGQAGAAAQTRPSYGKYGSTDDVTAERIFVCGAVNAALTNGSLDPSRTAIMAFVIDLRAVWRNSLGHTQVDHDMNDSIDM